jgi:hypothetical protein
MADPIEDRLGDALRRHAGGDDGVAGLAAGARQRAARRSRRRTTGAVVAAVLVVAAVPTAIALAGSSPTVAPAPAPPTTSDAAPTPDTPDLDVRVESWRDLTVSVPSGWGYGGGSDWCADDGTGEQPEVVRPGGPVRAIGCTPRRSYGLYFVDSSAIQWALESGDVWQYGWESPGQAKAYPEDAWLGLLRVGDHAVLVVTPEEATTREVLGSATQVTGSDPNGCATRDGEDAATGDGTGERWSVCRYDADGWLEQSELLTAEQSAELLAAVRAAPEGAQAVPCGEPVEPDDSGRVVLGNGSDVGSVSVVFQRACPAENGVHLSGTTRQLTADVLYWALSPGWSGATDGTIPLPDELRQN